MVVIPPDRVTLYSLEDEGANLEYLGNVDIGGMLTMHALWVALETNDALVSPFAFWDAEGKQQF